jgi:hypothetical protein
VGGRIAGEVDRLDHLEVAGLGAHDPVELFARAAPHARKGHHALLELAAVGAGGRGEAGLDRLVLEREVDVEEVAGLVGDLVALAIEQAERAVGDFLDHDAALLGLLVEADLA